MRYLVAIGLALLAIAAGILAAEVTSVFRWIGHAYAKAPPDADPRYAAFFRSLHRLDTGVSCCGPMTDCHRVPPGQVRSPRNSLTGQWQVYVDKDTFGPTAPNSWIAIPPQWVDDKPTTLPRPPQAIACWYPWREEGSGMPGGHMWCFKTPEPEG